jgi:hypothetical protein
MYSLVQMCLCRALLHIATFGSISADPISNICIVVQYIYVTLNIEFKQVMQQPQYHFFVITVPCRE